MKNLFNLLIAFGILTLIGTMGASDVGALSFNDMLSQICLSFILVLSGFAGKYLLSIIKCLSKKYYAKKRAQRYSYI
ncbi:MAG: hypothetical protein E7404_01895 [Ruminococcaceae bacterium]|nr:hypothetical protein [Oscillospiraceae bacterium]